MKKSIDLLRRELHAFCALAIRRGWRIRSGAFTNPETKTCCPLGAIHVVTGKPYSHYLLLDGSAASDFWTAFDGRANPTGPIADLGREFRAQYCGDGR